MTKAELVNEISVRTGISREDTLIVVEGFMSEVKIAMRKGDNIYFRGFGTFLVKTRKEKTGRNITQKSTIIIPEHKIAAFKATKDFIYENGDYMSVEGKK